MADKGSGRERETYWRFIRENSNREGGGCITIFEFIVLYTCNV